MSTQLEAQRQPRDINRQLIQQYDQPGGGSGGEGTFFNDNPPVQQQSPEERILSLNPDMPESIHIYSSLRRNETTGLDVVEIKKMLHREQDVLRSKMMKEPQQITPEQDQSKLKGGTPINEFLVEIPPDQREQKPQPETPSPEQPSPENKYENMMNKMMSMLERMVDEVDTIKRDLYGNKEMYVGTDKVPLAEEISTTEAETANVDTKIPDEQKLPPDSVVSTTTESPPTNNIDNPDIIEHIPIIEEPKEEHTEQTKEHKKKWKIGRKE